MARDLIIDRYGMRGEIRPIVTDADGDVTWTTDDDPAAEFGLYRYDVDGLAEHVQDFPTREAAHAAAVELDLLPLAEPGRSRLFDPRSTH